MVNLIDNALGFQQKSSHDCGQCGAVLLPKNEHGYARTQIDTAMCVVLKLYQKELKDKEWNKEWNLKNNYQEVNFLILVKNF